ncbi:MAG: hypothetical protein MAG471_01001 [Acidimicrobiaceae bacterium]|nr:hypothetical protein [Acidimicrobiaceae bacterium]
MRRRRPTGDLGQILPLVLVMVALGAAMALLVAQLGVVAVDRARARSAADAAALAAVTERGDGRTVAREFASANGARLESFEHAGGEVRVVVSVGRARATARAVAVLCNRGEPCVRSAEP